MLLGRLVSAVSISLIATVIMTTNDAVAQPLLRFVRDDHYTQLRAITGEAYRFGNIFADTVSLYTGDHTSMVVFGVFAVVLCGVMFRS